MSATRARARRQEVGQGGADRAAGPSASTVSRTTDLDPAAAARPALADGPGVPGSQLVLPRGPRSGGPPVRRHRGPVPPGHGRGVRHRRGGHGGRRSRRHAEPARHRRRRRPGPPSRAGRHLQRLRPRLGAGPPARRSAHRAGPAAGPARRTARGRLVPAVAVHRPRAGRDERGGSGAAATADALPSARARGPGVLRDRFPRDGGDPGGGRLRGGVPDLGADRPGGGVRGDVLRPRPARGAPPQPPGHGPQCAPALRVRLGLLLVAAGQLDGQQRRQPRGHLDARARPRSASMRAPTNSSSSRPTSSAAWRTRSCSPRCRASRTTTAA